MTLREAIINMIHKQCGGHSQCFTSSFALGANNGGQRGRQGSQQARCFPIFINEWLTLVIH